MSRSYREINQHPSLTWNFIAHGFLDPSAFPDEPPWGHGRPRLRVMDVRTKMLVFPGFRGPDRSFCPPDARRDIRVDVRRISGPKTYSLGCFFVPENNPHLKLTNKDTLIFFGEISFVVLFEEFRCLGVAFIITKLVLPVSH